MSKMNSKKPLAIAMGAALSGGLLATTTADAAANPFGLSELGSGYMQVAMEGNCGNKPKAAEEGKCGNKPKAAEEGKCGNQPKAAEEGKCGNKPKAAEEGKCGNQPKAMEEGKCGNKPAAKPVEGKCGEAKCGANKNK